MDVARDTPIFVPEIKVGKKQKILKVGYPCVVLAVFFLAQRVYVFFVHYPCSVPTVDFFCFAQQVTSRFVEVHI